MQAGQTCQVRSSSERTIERRLTPQPQGNDADQKTEEEELEEEGKRKEVEVEEDRFSPSSSCALPPSIRWENVSTLASCSADDHSSEGGDLSSVDRKVEEKQESPAAHPVKEGKVDSSKGCGAAAEGGGVGGDGAVAIGGVEGGANEVVLGGEGGGLNERCKNILRSATASSG